MPVPCRACREAGWLDAGMLEIPQSSDATIRLLKARIKSLEEQLGTALTLNQGAAVPVHAVKAVTTMAAYVLLVTYKHAPWVPHRNPNTCSHPSLDGLQISSSCMGK